MLQNKYTNKDHAGLVKTYQLVVLLSLEVLIPEDDSIRLLRKTAKLPISIHRPMKNEIAHFFEKEL